MTREEFRILASGKYATSQLTGPGAVIDKEKLKIFVDGALFGWDTLLKERAQAIPAFIAENSKIVQDYMNEGK